MKFTENWKRFWTLNRYHAAGFTLVELIVVIAILAILAGVAVPAYSGYIAEANRVADEQLLAAVNQAFAAACLENGVDASSLKPDAGVEIILSGNVGEKTVESVSLYNDDFQKYFEGNDAAQFKVIEELFFNYGTGVFSVDEVLTLPYGDGYISISASSLAALKGSAFATEMTPEELLGKVDYVTQLAAALMGDGSTNSTFEQLIKGPEYGQILADSLGIEYGGEEFMAKANSMIADKAALLIAQNPEKYAGEDPANLIPGSALYTDAYNQIVANNAVLNAARNSSTASSDILTVLGGTNSNSQIKKTIDKNSGEGLAQAAMAYGLYTAYAERNGLTVSDNPIEVLQEMDSDQNFKDYINNKDGKGYAQTDLDGYLASMEMINTNAAANKNAVSDILVNGFANKELVDLLNSAVNK